MVKQGGSVHFRGHLWWSELREGGNTDGSPWRVDGWWQNNETFAVWQEWMAHVMMCGTIRLGRCVAQIDAARCRDAMLKLYQVRARNDLKHHHELGKNESGDINSVKNGEQPKWREKSRQQGVGAQCWNCAKWEREMISSIITSAEKWIRRYKKC